MSYIQCIAITKNGNRCVYSAKGKSDKCGQHNKVSEEKVTLLEDNIKRLEQENKELKIENNISKHAIQSVNTTNVYLHQPQIYIQYNIIHIDNFNVGINTIVNNTIYSKRKNKKSRKFVKDWNQCSVSKMNQENYFGFLDKLKQDRHMTMWNYRVKN